jgi:hypothetical protein
MRPLTTNWDVYYNNIPCTAKITRKITTNILLELFKRHGVKKGCQIAEPGGANSCFYDAIRKQFSPKKYVIIDTNEIGMSMFLQKQSGNTGVEGWRENILSIDRVEKEMFDCVFSVGLIEHFSPEGTKLAIDAHFHLTRPGGLVVLLFPTLDIVYKITRSTLELTGFWGFPDERPLSIAEVRDTSLRFGDILEEKMNRKILLTQGIVCTRKR